jgi:hypothetical protein
MNICKAPGPPIFPALAVKLTPAPTPVTSIFTVAAPAVLLIDPAAVIPTAPAAASGVISALAPKATFRPAFKVIVPPVEWTVPLMLMSPTLVLAVMPMFPDVVIPAAIVAVLPAVNAIAPDVEFNAALIVSSLLAPVEVKVKVPAPPAVTALLTVNEPAEAIKEMFPEVVVVTPLLTVKLPLAAVKLKFILVTAAFTSVDNTPLVIVYVVSPSPTEKAMLCTVLTCAVTVKVVRVALPTLNKSTSSAPKAFSVKAEPMPV